MSETDASLLSEAIEQTGRTDMDGKYLTFVTDKQLFAIPIANVLQIVGMQDIAEIPDFPSYAKGIINLRGIIIPLIDMRLRLGKNECAYDERTCIIVTVIQDITAGFIVDQVDSVANISDESICPPPKLSDKTIEGYLTGVAKAENKIILLLNTAKLLSSEILTDYETIGGTKRA